MFQSFAKLFGLGKPKVGWLLLGDINTGSSRIHGINIHNYLLKQRIESVVYQSNPLVNRNLTLTREQQVALLSSGTNILIFQKVFDEKAVAFAREARQRGIKTIFLQSDKLESEMVNAVDQLVVTSEYLKGYFDQNFRTNAIVIKDAIEVPEEIYKEHVDKSSLQLVWVGHSDNWQTLDIVKNALERLADETYSLKTISNHPDADVKWELDTVFGEILTGDVAVIPAFDNDWGKSKSNNRLTMFMAMGMPAIASSVPAYRRIISNGVNGFLADHEDQWQEYLLQLKAVERRKKLGDRARRDIAAGYRIDAIGARWLQLFDTLLNKRVL